MSLNAFLALEYGFYHIHYFQKLRILTSKNKIAKISENSLKISGKFWKIRKGFRDPKQSFKGHLTKKTLKKLKGLHILAVLWSREEALRIIRERESVEQSQDPEKVFVLVHRLIFIKNLSSVLSFSHKIPIFLFILLTGFCVFLL